LFRLRRVLISSFVAVTGVMLFAVQAFAIRAYCQWDPPVLVVTPSGHLAVVYVDVSSPFADVGEGLVTYKATRAYSSTGAPVTSVSMKVWVPSLSLTGPFPVNDVASSGLLGGGTHYASASGMSGQTIPLYFTLNTP